MMKSSNALEMLRKNQVSEIFPQHKIKSIEPFFIDSFSMFFNKPFHKNWWRGIDAFSTFNYLKLTKMCWNMLAFVLKFTVKFFVFHDVLTFQYWVFLCWIFCFCFTTCWVFRTPWFPYIFSVSHLPQIQAPQKWSVDMKMIRTMLSNQSVCICTCY